MPRLNFSVNLMSLIQLITAPLKTAAKPYFNDNGITSDLPTVGAFLFDAISLLTFAPTPSELPYHCNNANHYPPTR